MALRAARLVGSLLLGMLAGITGTLLQPAWWGPVPVGVIVALTGTAAVLLTAGWWVGSRAGVLAAAAGWLGAISLAYLERPEGDRLLTGLVPTDPVWLYGGVGVIFAALALPYAGMPREVSLSREPVDHSYPGSRWPDR